MSIVYFRFAARGSDVVQRSPLIEALVARAAAAAPAGDWRREAMRVIASDGPPPPSAGAAALASIEPAAAAGRWACIATPLHLRAGMTRVILQRDGIAELGSDESAQLARDFNRTFSESGTLMAVTRACVLVCVFDSPLDVTTWDPDATIDQDLFDCQPTGAGGARLRRLMSEIELWLFDHEINRARASRALAPVSGLWLWGGGPTGGSLPLIRGWTAGRDPLFSAFGDQSAWPSEAQPGVIVETGQPGTAQWAEVERRWLEPAASDLQSGRIARLYLSAADRCFSVMRRRSLRFWRRPKPWWESFGVTHGADVA